MTDRDKQLCACRMAAVAHAHMLGVKTILDALSETPQARLARIARLTRLTIPEGWEDSAAADPDYDGGLSDGAWLEREAEANRRVRGYN